MNGILLVSLFCDVCSAVSRSISWARSLPVVTEVMNWLSSSLLNEVAPTQSSMKRL